MSEPPFGVAVQVEPLVARVLAPNPSPYTYWGTQTYVVGATGAADVAVIDPGPDDAAHVDAIVAAAGSRRIAAILCTHTHRDHSPALIESGALFTGDHVMAWSTSVVSPPDGDMAAYMASLERLMTRDDRIYYPAHGDAIDRPQRLVRGMIGHRKQREGQILRLLRDAPRAIPDMVAQMYAGLDPRLHGAAGRSVLAHLIDLENRGLVVGQEDRWRGVA
ncbi:MBL fold metallo-hydrolase [Sphingomonas sp. CCH16-B10]|uniref:MBL fold metallo-hydrolase n=1 Tax=Sphingomonas sp. CCH16-B10 TaxID=1768755 RepID=UPI0008376510|nr:MBL fold metallo-hydrolase [Sphingomonas sp. CCH16-B10]